MKKRILAACSALALSLALGACAGTDDEPEVTTTTVETFTTTSATDMTTTTAVGLTTTTVADLTTTTIADLTTTTAGG